MNRRFTAGLWYAIVAGMIGMLLFLLSVGAGGRLQNIMRFEGETLWYFVKFPMIAFVCAVFLAEKYHESPKEVRLSSWVWRGAGIALVFHIAMTSLWFSDEVMRGIPCGPQSSDPTDYYDPFSMYLCMLFFGIFFLGGLEMLVGALTGWMLGLARKKQAHSTSGQLAQRLPSLSIPLRTLLWALIALLSVGVFYINYLCAQRLR